MRNSTLKAITNASVRNTLVNAAINGTLDIEDDGAATNAVRDEDGKRVKVGDRICAVAFDGRELFVTSVGDDYVFARPVGGGREWELHDGEFTVCNATAVNYAYSTDPIKLMIQYARKEDYGGILDMIDNSGIDYTPADTARRIAEKARKYYANGRNMATPANQEELVRLIGTLRVKGMNSTAVNYGTNPNYNPEEGMKFLAEHFDMFDHKVAQGMIRDAQRKGVAIPATVIAKAKRAGIMNAGLKTRNPVVANAIAWNGDGEMDAQTLTDLAIEAEKRGDVYEAARLKERAGELAKAMRRDDDANDNTFDIRVS